MIKLQFGESAGRFVQEYQAHRADHITKNDRGILFEKNTAVTDEVRRWILQFGADVKVIEPEWLAEEIRKEAKKMLEQS